MSPRPAYTTDSRGRRDYIHVYTRYGPAVGGPCHGQWLHAMEDNYYTEGRWGAGHTGVIRYRWDRASSTWQWVR